MQTLFIPDIIHIAFSDKSANSLRQENILIGIRTFATHKNDVDISPFLSDKAGQITITKAQIKQRVDNFISYGIMDYNSVESAKPNIKIYFWGNNSLERYINYWSSLLDDKKNRKQSEAEIKMYKTFEKDFAEIRKKEAEELEVFSSCFNRNTKQREDTILVEDIWDNPVTEKNYKVTLNV
jgi:hypothetical protein